MHRFTRSPFILTTRPSPPSLRAYRSSVGYFAWRNSFQGSWFIQELCRVLGEDSRRPVHHHHDVLTLLTVVARCVACRYQSRSAMPDFNSMLQMTSTYSTLTRLAYITGPPRAAVTNQTPLWPPPNMCCCCCLRRLRFPSSRLFVLLFLCWCCRPVFFYVWTIIELTFFVIVWFPVFHLISVTFLQTSLWTDYGIDLLRHSWNLDCFFTWLKTLFVLLPIILMYFDVSLLDTVFWWPIIGDPWMELFVSIDLWLSSLISSEILLLRYPFDAVHFYISVSVCVTLDMGVCICGQWWSYWSGLYYAVVSPEHIFLTPLWQCRYIMLGYSRATFVLVETGRFVIEAGTSHWCFERN